MNEMVLLSLRRKLEMYKRAGMSDRAERTAALVGIYEAELMDIPESSEIGTVFVSVDPMDPKGQQTAPAGVALTPAAQELADELGVTEEDLKLHTPSGKEGFLKSDIKRIAEAKAHTEEDDTDGDD